MSGDAGELSNQNITSWPSVANQGRHATHATHDTVKAGCVRAHRRHYIFDSFSSEEASRSGALSLSLAFPSTLAVSLGLPHSKPFNQKPLQHGTMSKKKKEWRVEKGERLSGFHTLQAS